MVDVGLGEARTAEPLSTRAASVSAAPLRVLPSMIWVTECWSLVNPSTQAGSEPWDVGIGKLRQAAV